MSGTSGVDTLLGQLREIAARLSDFIAANAEPAAQMGGTLIQAMVLGKLIGVFVATVLTAGLIVYSIYGINRALYWNAQYSRTHEDNCEARAMLFGLSAAVSGVVGLIGFLVVCTDKLSMLPVWWAVVSDWRLALAAKAMGIV